MSVCGTDVVGRLEREFSGVEFSPGPLMAREGGEEQICVRVGADRLVEVLRFLREEPGLAFDQLCHLTCVDYLDYPGATDRFGVVYSLLSVEHGHRIWVKCFVNDPIPTVPTVTGIWAGANWMEREVWDMFGVRFEGHRDLRRILTWEGFKAHPLRKDYPLRGRGEREDYRVVGRESA
ncbi:MAG: NADH-quinone oxidoreductase subunit C [Phycisphaerae bacterium]